MRKVDNINAYVYLFHLTNQTFAVSIFVFIVCTHLTSFYETTGIFSSLHLLPLFKFYSFIFFKSIQLFILTDFYGVSEKAKNCVRISERQGVIDQDNLIINEGAQIIYPPRHSTRHHTWLRLPTVRSSTRRRYQPRSRITRHRMRLYPGTHGPITWHKQCIGCPEMPLHNP